MLKREGAEIKSDAVVAIRALAGFMSNSGDKHECWSGDDYTRMYRIVQAFRPELLEEMLQYIDTNIDNEEIDARLRRNFEFIKIPLQNCIEDLAKGI